MNTPLLASPTNVAAEYSVLGHMLTRPDVIGEVIGVPLEQADFSQPDTRVVFATAIERHYAGLSVDPLVVGELCKDELAQYWSADPKAIGQLLTRRAQEGVVSGSVLDHAAIVKQLSTKRKLMDTCYQALSAISEGRKTPEEIGDELSTQALQATAGSVKRTELMNWMDTGREYVRQLQRVIQAKQQGIEIGVYTGLPFIDSYTTGIAPGELCFIAGEPGAGKTALGWAAGLGFASRQMSRDPEKRVGTLMVSAEMTLYSSTQRVVQNLTGIDGVRLREGAISPQEYRRILTEWKNREDLPLYWNFASNFRLSQLRALVAEGIRKANVGFVVIDHFRMIDTDRRYQNGNDADEAKVRFLKENLAKDLNIAVMCLAHTVKVGRGQGNESPRPRLSDLRGSGMITAFADQVGFMWSPYKYMSEEARTEMFASASDVELDWQKNRFGKPESAQLTFVAETMKVLPR